MEGVFPSSVFAKNSESWKKIRFCPNYVLIKDVCPSRTFNLATALNYQERDHVILINDSSSLPMKTMMNTLEALVWRWFQKKLRQSSTRIPREISAMKPYCNKVTSLKVDEMGNVFFSENYAKFFRKSIK